MKTLLYSWYRRRNRRPDLDADEGEGGSLVEGEGRGRKTQSPGPRTDTGPETRGGVVLEPKVGRKGGEDRGETG